jgi:hypothetical protein
LGRKRQIFIPIHDSVHPTQRPSDPSTFSESTALNLKFHLAVHFSRTLTKPPDHDIDQVRRHHQPWEINEDHPTRNWGSIDLIPGNPQNCVWETNTFE